MVWFGSLAQVCRSYSNNPRQPASQINNDDAQPPCERTARPGQVYTMRQRARSLRIRPLFACKVPTAALHDDSQIGCAATEIVSRSVTSQADGGFDSFSKDSAAFRTIAQSTTRAPNAQDPLAQFVSTGMLIHCDTSWLACARICICVIRPQTWSNGEARAESADRELVCKPK
ncbi:hypothetical protein AB1N83_012781 [Pleurotus pulmonarius]